MVTEYHKSVQDALINFGESLLKQKKIKKLYEGNKKPLSIVDSGTKFVVNYKPDVFFVLKNNKKLIFEILDSEEKKQDIIIADIIRSILVENVDGLIFLYPGDQKDERTILEALKTMYKGLIDDLGVNLNDLPNTKKTGPYSITRKEAQDHNTVISKLEEYLDFL